MHQHTQRHATLNRLRQRHSWLRRRLRWRQLQPHVALR